LVGSKESELPFSFFLLPLPPCSLQPQEKRAEERIFFLSSSPFECVFGRHAKEAAMGSILFLFFFPLLGSPSSSGDFPPLLCASFQQGGVFFSFSLSSHRASTGCGWKKGIECAPLSSFPSFRNEDPSTAIERKQLFFPSPLMGT